MASLSNAVPPNRTFIKICGITTLADAALCATLGVNAVGILLQKKPGEREAHSDQLTVEEATVLVAGLPRSLIPVLLVHAIEVEKILEHCARISPGALQVQKPVSASDLRRVKQAFPSISIIKTFRVVPNVTVDSITSEIDRYIDEKTIDAVLLDAAKGGTGEVIDWGVAAELVKRTVRRPTLLAGGLKYWNVGEAIRQVRPWGVDVMTGVTSPLKDRKDPDALRKFVRAVCAEGNAS